MRLIGYHRFDFEIINYFFSSTSVIEKSIWFKYKVWLLVDTQCVLHTYKWPSIAGSRYTCSFVVYTKLIYQRINSIDTNSREIVLNGRIKSMVFK